MAGNPGRLPAVSAYCDMEIIICDIDYEAR